MSSSICLALEAWLTISFSCGLQDRLWGSSSIWSLSLIWLPVGLLGRNFGQFQFAEALLLDEALESSRVHSILNELSILYNPIRVDQFSGPVMKVPERKTK